VNIEQALEIRKGKRLVFTNGVFDIIHAGHVQYLDQARTLGDMLLVGVNSDSSAKRLGKGPNRPVNREVDRVLVVEGLRAVDGAILFDEDTPEELIWRLRPEVHVKGGDYQIEDLPEAKIVQGYGGEVVILEFLPGRSTTSTLKRLAQE
jgi:D-glycero-beta-D-manno-heptose 1-phosphate adenylyltransferase